MSKLGTSGDNQQPRNPLEELMSGAFEDHDLDEIPGATYWPEVLAVEAAAQWEELRVWVEQLQERFSHLDHHVVPLCWWRHNEHVEALFALRDHERCSFAATAPATAPVDWFRALRDITAMLRSWSGDLSCGAVHQDPPTRSSPPVTAGWNPFVQADVERRKKKNQADRVSPRNHLQQATRAPRANSGTEVPSL